MKAFRQRPEAEALEKCIHQQQVCVGWTRESNSKYIWFASFTPDRKFRALLTLVEVEASAKAPSSYVEMKARDLW